MSITSKDGFKGNSSTSTKLITPRTINGTNFDGTANITTANWGTSRTLTVGNTGKSVNGAGNVSWSLSEIGAASSNHSHSNATTSTSGYMSSSDKSKLDGIQAGAKNISVVNNLTSGGTTSALSAEQGKVLKGLVDGKAASSHTHSYLPLTGGVINGSVIKITGNQTYYASYLQTLQGNVFQGNYGAMVIENNAVGRIHLLNHSGEPAIVYAKSFTPKTILSANMLSKVENSTNGQPFDILNNISVLELNGEKVITPKINSEYKIDENSNVPFITTEFMENGDIVVTNDINSMIALLTESVKQLYEDNQSLIEDLNNLKSELNTIKNS